MEKPTSSPLPQNNKKSIVAYDPVRSEKELKKLEEMRLHFISLASEDGHTPYHRLKIKPAMHESLISRLPNLKAMKESVTGILKSIIF
jgi:hypothetical protein